MGITLIIVWLATQTAPCVGGDVDKRARRVLQTKRLCAPAERSMGKWDFTGLSMSYLGAARTCYLAREINLAIVQQLGT